MTVSDERTVPGAPVGAPRGSRWWAIVGGLLAVITVGWGAINVVALLAHRTTTQHHEYPASQVSAIEVSTSGGSVRVVRSNGTTIRVTSTIDEGLRSPRNRQRLEAGVLTIHSACPSMSIMWCDVAYVVEVPIDVPLTVTTEMGDISVRGVTAAMRLSSDTGDIRVEQAGAASVEVSTDLGDVTLGFGAAPTEATVRTGTGDILLIVPDDQQAYVVDATSDSGSVDTRLRTDPDSPRHIRTVSDTGNLTIRYADR